MEQPLPWVQDEESETAAKSLLGEMGHRAQATAIAILTPMAIGDVAEPAVLVELARADGPAVLCLYWTRPPRLASEKRVPQWAKQALSLRIHHFTDMEWAARLALTALRRLHVMVS